MRTIEITLQEYKSLGLVNILSYEILPFNNVNFPFTFILFYNTDIVIQSIEYLTPEELDDWSIYPTLDDKIKAKLNLI
jgi:hypothetical protein